MKPVYPLDWFVRTDERGGAAPTSPRGVKRITSGPALTLSALLVLLSVLSPLYGADAPSAGQAPSGDGAATTTLVLPAEVLAYQSAVITAKVAGYLRKIPVDKGDKVKAGDLIADIEVPELLADRLQYQAQVDVAKREYTRMQEAAKTAPDLVTPDNLDNSRGKLEVAQAQLDRVNALLSYARVTAPFSGTITARYVDAGAFIPVPSQSSQQSAAIVTLMDFSHVRIQMWVPETNAYRVRAGCKAVITTSALPNQHLAATVTRVSYALERNVRTMLAEIDMPNPHELLQPGMYLSVRLTLEPEKSSQAQEGVRVGSRATEGGARAVYR